MIELLSRLVGIVLLRQGPQDLPAGQSLLPVCMALYLIVTTFSLSIGETPANPVGLLGVALLLPLILSWIVLRMRARVARWQQTVAALFGTSAVLSALNLPFAAQTGGDEVSAPVGLALLGIFFWKLAVDGHIWRHALDVAFSTGLAIAVVLFAVSLLVINTFSGGL